MPGNREAVKFDVQAPYATSLPEFYYAPMKHEVPVYCGKDCGGNACPLLATVVDGRVVRLRDNPAGGQWIKPCPRGYLLHRASYARDRLLSPLIADGPRGSGRYRAVGWDEALDLVAGRLEALRARWGGSSILAMGSTGSNSVLQNTENLVARFLNASRLPGRDPGPATFMSSNYSNGASRFVLPYLYGAASARSGWDAATVRHSRLIVLWGANVLEARLGAEFGLRVAQAARAGVPVVVVDPRRSATAKAVGARWIPIRPGTDAAMMLAMLQVLWAEGLVDRVRVSTIAHGMDQLEAYVTGQLDGTVRDPAWAQGICGVPAADIASFAREYAAAKPAMLMPGYSIQRVRAGEETYRLGAAIQLATGNFGVLGGSTASINNRLPGPRIGGLDDLSRGDEPKFPVLRWPDAILEGKAGGYPTDIKAAYLAGCNFVNQGADTNKNIRAMQALEFSVCHEMFMTPTARLCDVILPAASPLEKEDIAEPWDGNYLLYKPKAVEPEGLAMDDYRIFSALADRMGFGQRFHEGKDASAWIDQFLADSDIPDLAAFKASGLYLAAEQERVGLADFATDPVAHPLPTPSGKVEILSERYAAETGGSALPTWDPPPPDPAHPFLLVSPKTIRRTHSQNGGGLPWTGSARGADSAEVTSSAQAAPDAGELSINSADARALDLADGDTVLVGNAVGRLTARVLVTDDIMPGVVCLHEGSWVSVGQDGIDAGGSANVLSSTDGTGPAVGPVMHGIAVSLARVPDQGPS
jgi:anaerobic dimethyl sulfoxide reductase subunit A